MVQKITDLELASHFSKELYEDYCMALEFIKSNPDYSLLKFRHIIENIINEIAISKKVKFPDEMDSIYSQIEYLYSIQIINKNFKDNFHLIRKLCNSGVHKNINFQNSIEEDLDFYEKNKEQLVQKSSEARQKINLIFVDALYILESNFQIRMKDIQFIDIKQKEFKDILFQAITDIDFKKKLTAGLTCEIIKQEQQFQKGLLVSSDFGAHVDCLDEMASTFYDAACRISANFDKNLTNLNNDKESTIKKFSEVESLYRFANSILSDDDVDKQSNDIAWGRLKAAADRAYSPAQGLYGAYLYKLKRYEEALKYLTEAQKKDEVLALRFLFYYYSDIETSALNVDLAIDFLKKAVELGCSDSLATLGIEHHKGIIFEKDDNKAKFYLENSIQQGSALGRKYYLIEFNDLKGEIFEYMQSFANQLEKMANINKRKPIKSISKKIRPNDQCPCSSGKKYKKCCYLYGDSRTKEILNQFVKSQIG